jgi:hypothetical protein
VDAAGGGHYSRNVLKSLVTRSGPELMHEISSKYDRNRTNYIEHATELADFVDELWNERNLSRNTGRSHRDGSQVNAIKSKRDTRTCEFCKKKGHVAKYCRSRKKATEDKDKDSFAFSVGYDKDVEKETTSSTKVEDILPTKIEWILDSGCGRHLTGNASLFGNNTNAARTSLILPDGTRATSMHKGNIEMVTRIRQAKRHINVEDVEYVPGFKKNLLSYVHLEKKGVRLSYEDNKRYVMSKTGIKLAEVQSEGDVWL